VKRHLGLATPLRAGESWLNSLQAALCCTPLQSIRQSSPADESERSMGPGLFLSLPWAW